MSTEKWTVKLGGHVQLDYINWADAQDPPVPALNYFEFRRLRLMADGTGYGVYDFRLQIDIEPESGDGTDRARHRHQGRLLHDERAAVPHAPWRDRQLLRAVQPGAGDQRHEQHLPRAVDPDAGHLRRRPRSGHGARTACNDAQNFTWTFGTFFDSISESLKERIDDNQGQRVSGRLTWLPYYDEPSNGRYLVHTGAGVLYTDDQDDIAPLPRPAADSRRPVPDRHRRACRPASTRPATSSSPPSGDRSRCRAKRFSRSVNQIAGDTDWVGGAYVYCSYFLTGENRIYERFGQHGAQFGRNVPYSNFFWVPGCCGPGAWEVKARWSNLTLNEARRGRIQRPHARLQLVLERPHPHHVRLDPPGDQRRHRQPFGATDSDIIGMRFDFNF